jgi:hypothetical protein
MTRLRCTTIFNVAGYLVLLSALPAVLENMWEVYWGTIASGPQMIGFVLAHANPDSALVRVIRYSSYASIAFSAVGIMSIARMLAAGVADRHQKLFSWSFLVLSAHGLGVALYPYWSPLFDRGATP